MTQEAVLILGARSDIGLAIAHRFARAGHPVQLAARQAGTLETDRTDMALRYGVEVSLHEFDVLETSAYSSFIETLSDLPGVVVCAVGYMGEQAENARDADLAARVLRSNFEGPAAILADFANWFEARGSGCLVGISSVAGERGRASNYVYGAAKAGYTAFLSGLRNRLAKKGVHVVTVLPGFVATQMTEGMDLPEKLTAQPDEVAQAVFNAVERKKNVIYVRPVWRLIMAIIKALPEPIFKRTSI